MSQTLSLPYTRFVAQTSNGSARSKSSYLSMMAENEIALQSCEWHEATTPDNEVAIPVNNVFLAEGYTDDRYDAYIRGGRANSGGTDTFEGYAGMVAYRIKLPDAYLSGTAHLQSFTAIVSRDRFLRAGVRIVAALSSSAQPSADWSVVRGEDSTYKTASTTPETGTDGVRSYGLLNQSAIQYLVDTRAAETTATIDLSGIDTVARAQYLYIYVTLEDYQNRWIWHSSGERREYWIEGAAQIVGASNSVTFDADVASDGSASASSTVIQAGGASPTFITTFIRMDANKLNGTSGTNSGAYPLLSLYPGTDLATPAVPANVGLAGPFAFADFAYQIASGAAKGSSPREIFDHLVNLGGRVKDGYLFGVAANVAFGFVKTTAGAVVAGVGGDDADALTIVPRVDTISAAGDQDANMQNGICVIFNGSGSAGHTITRQSIADPAGSSDQITVDQSIITNPAYLIVSALAVRATAGGRTLTLKAVGDVANTGIVVRFAVWQSRGAQWSGALAHCNVGQMLRTPGLALGAEVGKTLEVPALPEGAVNVVGLGGNIGGFSATCIGLTGTVDGPISGGNDLQVDLSERVNVGDVLLIVPVPVGLASDATQVYFGSQTSPYPNNDSDIANRAWARREKNLGWFPEVSIK